MEIFRVSSKTGNWNRRNYKTHIEKIVRRAERTRVPNETRELADAHAYAVAATGWQRDFVELLITRDLRFSPAIGFYSLYGRLIEKYNEKNNKKKK